MWAAVEAQLRPAAGGGQALAGAEQLARLLAAPGLWCAASLCEALQQLGQQVAFTSSLLNWNRVAIRELQTCCAACWTAVCLGGVLLPMVLWLVPS